MMRADEQDDRQRKKYLALVIEDASHVREEIQQFLERRGIEVIGLEDISRREIRDLQRELNSDSDKSLILVVADLVDAERSSVGDSLRETIDSIRHRIEHLRMVKQLTKQHNTEIFVYSLGPSLWARPSVLTNEEHALVMEQVVRPLNDLVPNQERIVGKVGPLGDRRRVPMDHALHNLEAMLRVYLAGLPGRADNDGQ